MWERRASQVNAGEDTSWELGRRQDGSYYLLVEEAVDQEDVDSLQDIGDGESIGNDGSDGFLYQFSEKEAKAPGTAQEEELSNGRTDSQFCPKHQVPPRCHIQETI